MITKMKKLTFLVYHKEYEAFLNGVRDLGGVGDDRRDEDDQHRVHAVVGQQDAQRVFVRLGRGAGDHVG